MMLQATQALYSRGKILFSLGGEDILQLSHERALDTSGSVSGITVLLRKPPHRRTLTIFLEYGITAHIP